MQVGDDEHANLTALFTFVARDPVTKRSMAINPLQPQTAEEVALFQERQAVADARKAARQGQPPVAGSGAPNALANVAVLSATHVSAA